MRAAKTNRILLVVLSTIGLLSGRVIGQNEANPGASGLKPRFEVYVPSGTALVQKVHASRGGWFVQQASRMYLASAAEGADGLKPDEILAVVAQIAQWPDTSVNAFVFAADLRGRPRWAVRVNWSVADLADRVRGLLQLPAMQEMVTGVRLDALDKNQWRLHLAGDTLAYLLKVGDSASAFSSHLDLPIPHQGSIGADTGQSEGGGLIAAKWTLAGTEADSGATFLSSFSAITDLTYTGTVQDDGNWSERLELHWPALSGMGAKAIFGRVKQTFFVPTDAFGAVVLSTSMLPGLLESMAGFGPQMILGDSGQMELVGEAMPGPIAPSIDSEICLAVLPGTGFLPAPDFIVQARARNADRFVESLRKETERLNKAYRERDRAEPWHEEQVLGRTFFWSDGSAGNYPGMLLPMVMRPVVFVSEERDATDKDRSFLVLGWTSTSPQEFVRRWIQRPRSENRVFVPAEKKSDGQVWVNWNVVYRKVVPYVNIALGSVIPGALLPNADKAADKLKESWVTAELSYGGLSVSHKGPLPLGALVLPSMGFAAAAPDDSGGSDLARERLATQRLEVLYHHAKLFQKDLKRWPAEVIELDGYVDFRGHPELLDLDLSSRKAWGEWFTEIFEDQDEASEDESEDDEIDAELRKLEDKLYKIEWGKDAWKLGLVPGTLEHLENLYIDQNGVVHRAERSAVEVKPPAESAETPPKPDDRAEAETSPATPVVEKVMKQAGKNLSRRYRQR